MGAAEIVLKLLDLLVAGSIAWERMAAIRDRVAAMKAEGRDPTPEEWTALLDEIGTDSARLDRAARSL
ncbi:hypothetical protein [Sphingomonas quercus]|uniref:Uncharacterized protein n=1 Tax=Sphingomonas quercus TaxID=2842451 RepID=A0ABS6BJJ4_9SPHN|nr:hypothetical protein [Sphingomonas quercus]MBU3078478.1 hypothetical protein [Sphingomonas quercus]